MPIPAGYPADGRCVQLTGRRAECDALNQLVAAVRAGASRALVVHGEAGVGKSALLEHLAELAQDCQVVRAAGVRAEMELAYATLQQLCAPMLDHLERLPGPQKDALRTAFGLEAGPAPDRFLVGLAAELERSADRARARGGLAAAAAFGERAVMLTPDPARRAGRALAAASTKIQAGALDAAQDLLATAEAGPLDEFERDLPAVARAADHAPRSRPGRRAAGLLLEGLAKHFTDGYAGSVAILREALTGFDRDLQADEELRAGWMACVAALYIWDDEGWHALSDRFVRLARDTGSLRELPLALTMRAHVHLFAGELSAAASLIGELQAVAEATGSNFTPYSALFHAALRGDGGGAQTLIEDAARDATVRGEGVGTAVTGWAQALLYNGLGRYQEAMTAAQRASGYADGDLGVRAWALVELVEAAARNEMAGDARPALAELTEQAVGEWLRRQRRRGDAREQLRTAHAMLEAMGMDAFAARARRELRATGETTRKRADPVGDHQLTEQETQIVRLARDGMSTGQLADTTPAVRTSDCRHGRKGGTDEHRCGYAAGRAWPGGRHGGAVGQRPAARAAN